MLYQSLADLACERITAAITQAETKAGKRPIQAVLDPYNPQGSSAQVQFHTSKTTLYATDPRRCPINWVVLDGDWEAEFCRVVEAQPQVLAYVKNHGLGFEVPYRYGTEMHKYLPDFIVLIDDGHGLADPLHLVVEIKGYRRENAKDKKNTMAAYWVPGVNQLKHYGRWAFAEFTDVWDIETAFAETIQAAVEKMIESATNAQ